MSDRAEPIGPIDPNVPAPDLVPPAFLDDDLEGSEWGWSDWDAPDWRELDDLIYRQDAND